MQLRDHPVTRRSGVKSWPPRWTNTTVHKTNQEGESARYSELRTILRSRTVFSFGSSTKILRMWAAMFFDDLAFCHIMRRILDSQIGLAIKKIGDLDLSFTL